MISHSGIWLTPDTGLVPSPHDIAVHMGRITRYAGAIWCPLLCHSVFVGELAWGTLLLEAQGKPFDYQTWAWALLHDAHETFMADIPRRWKIPERKAQEHEADLRLMAAYGLVDREINHVLIKACDEIALMAEAVVLDLPGFREKYCIEQKLAEFPEPTEAETDLMQALIGSDFYRAPACLDSRSTAVVGFALVLELVRKRELEGALHAFRSLLNRVLPEVPA
jgi:hypothetical protein